MIEAPKKPDDLDVDGANIRLRVDNVNIAEAKS
jgi:hypothetical protein